MLERLQKLQRPQRKKGFQLEGLDVYSEETVLRRKEELLEKPSGPETEANREDMRTSVDSALKHGRVNCRTEGRCQSSCPGHMDQSVSSESLGTSRSDCCSSENSSVSSSDDTSSVDSSESSPSDADSSV